MTEIKPVPEAEGFVPTTPDDFKTYATAGAMMAIFGCGDTLIRQGRLNPRLHQKMGIPALQRMYNEADKMNRSLEKMWHTRHADQMSFLFSDVSVVLLVLTSVDLESRTGLTSEFRRVWAQLLSAVGDPKPLEELEGLLAHIREQRQLTPKEPDAPDVEELSFFAGDTKLTVAVEREGELQPNCAIFVRDAHTKAILRLAQVQVGWADEVKDRFDYDADILYERQYPTGVLITFAAKAPGYAAGGCEMLFYEGDEAQLMINIWLHPLDSIPADATT